jgi:hypothetical protein
MTVSPNLNPAIQRGQRFCGRVCVHDALSGKHLDTLGTPTVRALYYIGRLA